MDTKADFFSVCSVMTEPTALEALTDYWSGELETSAKYKHLREAEAKRKADAGLASDESDSNEEEETKDSGHRGPERCSLGHGLIAVRNQALYRDVEENSGD